MYLCMFQLDSSRWALSKSRLTIMTVIVIDDRRLLTNYLL